MKRFDLSFAALSLDCMAPYTPIMQRLFLNPAYADRLESHKLASYASLVDQKQHGELVDSDKGRTTHKILLGEEAYYLKCVDKPTPASALEALLTLRRPHHYCWREMQQVMSLQKENVAVMDVAAAGESLSWGIPQFSFILVKEVPGQSLDGVFESSPPENRLLLLQQLGKLHGRLHRSGFFAPARMKDIIVDQQGQFVLIDRETRKPKVRRFTRGRALASLQRTMSRQARDGTFWSEAELSAYLEAYLDSTSPRLGLDAARLGALIAAR